MELELCKDETEDGTFHGVILRGKLPNVIEGVHAHYCLDNDHLTRIDGERSRMLEPLLAAADHGWVDMHVGRNFLTDFYYHIVPELAESVALSEPDRDEILRYLPPEVSFRFFLDVEDGTPVCRATADYGDRASFALTDWRTQKMTSTDFRDQIRESTVLLRVEEFFPELQEDGSLACAPDEDSVYRVLTEGVEALWRMGEVMSTDRFDGLTVRKSIRVQVGVSVESELMDLKISSEDVSLAELAEILNSYKLKKKYHRVEGYMFDNNGKPLTEAYVHVERDFFIGAATDSTGHFVFWVPKKDVTLCAEQAGYKSFKFSPTDKNLVMHLEKSYNGYNMRLRGNSQEQIAGLPKYVPEENEVRLLPQGVIRGSHNSPPNDSILYLINGVPQPKENNKWLDKRSYLDYFKGQHLLVSRVMDYKNVKQRYIEKYGEAAKHGVIEYICVEDTLCDYYIDQHEELKASRRRVTGVVYDENDEPLEHTMIHIFHDRRIWGTETTDSTGHFVFWVPRTDATLHFKYIGYKAVVVEATDTFHTIYLLPEATERSMK
jgi:hypothetical protein